MEQTLVEKVIDNNVWQRNFKCVYTVDAEKAANGALHRYRRVKVDKVLGILRNAAGRFAGFINRRDRYAGSDSKCSGTL